MGKTSETSKTIGKRISSLLGGKPIWVWWISYLAITGVIFGILSIAYYVLTFQWWIAVLIILATGLAWGTIAFMREKAALEKENKDVQK